MSSTVTMEALRAAGMPTEIAAMIMQLARQAGRARSNGDKGDKGDRGDIGDPGPAGVPPVIRSYTDPVEAEAAALTYPDDLIVLYRAT